VTFSIVALPSDSPQIILREGWRAVHVITSGDYSEAATLP